MIKATVPRRGSEAFVDQNPHVFKQHLIDFWVGKYFMQDYLFFSLLNGAFNISPLTQIYKLVITD